MKVSIALQFISLWIVFLSMTDPAKGQSILTGVSVDPSKYYMSNAGGSLNGGTVVYISGSGFKGNENALTVGFLLGHKVYIPELRRPIRIMSGTKISFETPPLREVQKYFEEEKETREFEIILQSGTKTISCNIVEKGKCKYTYSINYTPRLHWLTPIIYAGQKLEVNIMLFQTKDIQGGQNLFREIDIGDGTCILGEDFTPETVLNYHDEWAYLNCTVKATATPSASPVRFQTIAGDAYPLPQIERADITETSFQLRIVPLVEDIFPKEMGLGGGLEMTIQGAGFSPVKSENQVLIGGVNCPITHSSVNHIKCTVPPKTPAFQSQTQWGLERLVFDTDKWTNPESVEEFSNFENYIERNHTLIPYYRARKCPKVRTEVWRGYFIPPEDGEYRFRSASYPPPRIYLDGTTISPGTWFLPHRKDYYVSEGQNTEFLELTGGQKYEFRINRYLDTGENRYLNLGLEKKHMAEHLLNIRQVQRVKIDGDPKFETHYFTIKNPPVNASEYYYWKLSKNDNEGNPKEAIMTPEIYLRCSGAEFRTAMYTPFAGFWINIKVHLKDAAGEDLTNTTANLESADLSELTYEVNIRSANNDGNPRINRDHSPSLILSESSTLTHQMFAYTYDEEITIRLGGTYGVVMQHPTEGALEFGPFPICASSQNLLKIVEEKYPFLIGKIDIFRDISQVCYDFNRVSFQFKGFEDIPLMTFSTDTEIHNITGGRAEMYIEEIVISQEHSKNLFWEHIPPEYLSVGDVEGLVQVKTKGLESACPKLDCTFSYAATAPEITDFDYDTGSRFLNITGTNFDTTTIESIEFGGEPCEGMSKTAIEVNCTLPNSPVGGVYQPEVIYEEGVWILPAKTITIDYTITSVAPSTLNPSGGQLVTITGSGFPKTLEAGKEILAVSFDSGSSLPLLSCTDTEVTIITPKLGPTPVLKMALKGELKEFTTLSVDTTSFPSVTAVSPITGSPVFHEELVMTITGDITSNTKDELRVYLVGEGEKQEVGIKAVTNTDPAESEIRARFIGGEKGTYSVEVHIANTGYLPSTATFNIAASVESISPVSGSFMGGTELTLTGSGFSTHHEEMYAYIGDTQCVITSSTGTQIKCTTQAATPHSAVAIPSTDLSEIAAVTLRLATIARCAASCYTFSVSNTALLGGLEVNSHNQLVITGSNLDVSGSLKVYIDGVEGTLVSQTGTELVAQIIQSSNMLMGRVEVIYHPQGKAFFLPKTTDPEVDPLPKDYVAIPVTFTGVDTSVISEGGSRLKIIGYGFADSSTQQIDIIGGGSDTICKNIKWVSFTELICETKSLTISSPETLSMILNLEAPLPITCTNNDPEKCKISTTADYTGLYSVYTPSHTLGDMTITADFESNITNCASVKIEVEKIGTTTCTPPTQCVYTPGVANLGSYETYLVCTDSSRIIHILAQETLTVSDIEYTFTPSLPLEVSFGGGLEVDIGAKDIGNKYDNGEVTRATVCGQPAIVSKQSVDGITLKIPSISTNYTVTNYLSHEYDKLSGTYFTETGAGGNAGKSFDGDLLTAYESNTDSCYVGVELEEKRVLKSATMYITELPTWHPDPVICHKNEYIEHRQAVYLESSDDGITYTTVTEIPYLITHPGWNPFILPESEVKGKYFRARFEKRCNIGELELVGELIIEQDTPETSCPIKIEYLGDPNTEVVFEDRIVYKNTLTSVITEVTPDLLKVELEAEVQLTGVDLPTDIGNIVSISLSGVSCIPEGTLTSTSTTCKIKSLNGLNNNPDIRNIEYVIKERGAAIVQDGVQIQVVHKWSSKDTWGGILPQEGDSVHIPASQSVLYDVLTSPILDTVVIEGSLIFEDAINAVSGVQVLLQARRIMVREGLFRVGTKDNPYLHNTLTIKLHGEKENKQLPIFGTKFLGIYDGHLEMFGKEVTPTWTTLKSSHVGYSDTIILNGPLVNWVVGDEIIIAPSDRFDQTEIRNIKSISGEGTDTVTIVLNRALRFPHILEQRIVGDKTFTFSIEVGHLNRNIKMVGDDSSPQTFFGGVLKVYGKSVAQLEHVEFKHMGQAYQFDQYAITFEHVDCPECYVKHCAIHASYNKGYCAVNSFRLLAEDNIAGDIDGDGFAVDNVVYIGEVWNTFKHNLAIGIRNAWGFLEQGMVKGDGFAIPGPPNHLLQNVATGCEGAGYHYYTVCYYENHLWPFGQFDDNQAHTTRGSGFHAIFLYPRKVPLSGPTTLLCAMPYHHHIRYREGKRGAMNNMISFNSLCENIYFFDVGAMDMNNIIVSDGRKGNFYNEVTDHIETIEVDGMYVIAGVKDRYFGIGSGVWSDGLNNNVTFANFIDHPAMMSSPTYMTHYGENYYLSWANVTYVNTTNYIKWHEHEMWTDVDGTLAGVANSTLTWFEPHLFKEEYCTRLPLEAGYDDTLQCTHEVQIRTFYVTNIKPPELLYYNMTLFRQESSTPMSANELGDFLAQDTLYGNYSWRFMWVPWEYFNECFKLHLIVGETYWMRWRHDLDPLSFDVYPWHRWTDQDPASTIKMQLKDDKEYLNVSQVVQDQLCDKTSELLDQKTDAVQVDSVDSTVGDYNYNMNSKILSFSLSKKPTEVDWIHIHSEKKLKELGEETDFEVNFRRFSVAGDWTSGAVPVAGESIEIEKRWQMYMDMNTPILNVVTVNGRLVFPNEETAEYTLRARKIDINRGEIIIGTSDTPYTGKATIHIESKHSDLGESTHFGAINCHGNLTIFGKEGRKQRISQLYEFLHMDTNTLEIDSGLDWVTTDEITIAASGFGGESERRSISSYTSATGVLVLTENIEYDHLPGTAIHNIGGYNVHIHGNTHDNWGGQIRAEDRETAENIYVANIHVKNVYFSNMGHNHNEAMAFMFYFYNTQQFDRLAIIEKSVFIEIYGGALDCIDANGVQFKDNLIYRPYMLGLFTERANNIIVTGNTIMSVEDEEWKLYWLLKGLTLQGGFFICPFSQHKQCVNVTFSNNKVLGSETNGIATQGLPCANASSYAETTHVYYNNTVSSSTWTAWFLEANDRETFDCMLLKDFTMVHNLNYSLFIENRTYSLTLENAVFDTCFEAIGFGDGIINHTYNGTFKNVQFIGLHENGTILNTKKRPELERTIGYEFDNLAVEYYYGDPANHFNLCDNTAIFYDAIIKNFRKLELSQKNAALWVSERWNTYSHEFLYPWILFERLRIENTEAAYFLRWESWFQHLIAFRDTVFVQGEQAFELNNSATLQPNFQIVNNSIEVSGKVANCYFQSAWNAYYCTNPNLGVLCMNTHLRMAKTIHFMREDGFHSTDFSRKQLVIDGDIRRVSWLVNLVETTNLKNKYNVTFESSLPPKITYFMLGQEKEKGVELRVEYQKPLSIHLLINETRIERKFFSNIESVKTPEPMSKCGDNLWDVTENILTLYIDGNEWCQIRAETVNALMVTLRLEVSVADFFATGGQQTFIDRVSAVLGIAPYRVRIAGISEGSTVLTSFVEGEKGKTDEETRAELTKLNDMLGKIIESGELKLGYNILEYSIQNAFAEEEESTPTFTSEKNDGNDDEDKTMLIIICCIAGGIIGIAITVVIILIILRKKKKVKSDVVMLKTVESPPNSAGSPYRKDKDKTMDLMRADSPEVLPGTIYQGTPIHTQGEENAGERDSVIPLYK